MSSSNKWLPTIKQKWLAKTRNLTNTIIRSLAILVHLIYLFDVFYDVRMYQVSGGMFVKIIKHLLILLYEEQFGAKKS